MGLIMDFYQSIVENKRNCERSNIAYVLFLLFEKYGKNPRPTYEKFENYSLTYIDHHGLELKGPIIDTRITTDRKLVLDSSINNRHQLPYAWLCSLLEKG